MFKVIQLMLLCTIILELISEWDLKSPETLLFILCFCTIM